MDETISIKEYVKELRNDLKREIQLVREGNDLAIKTQTEILGTLTNIDNHLGTLNSKVATHEKSIAELKYDQNKFKTVVSTLMTIAGIIWAGFTFLFK